MVSHLGPGGVFVMDGWVRPDAWREDTPIHLLTASDATVTVVRMSRSRREGNRTFLDMHHLIGSHDGIDHELEVHDMTLFEPRSTKRHCIVRGSSPSRRWRALCRDETATSASEHLNDQT